MKFIVIAVKGLKEMFRDRKGLVFMLLFPLMFVLVFRLAFGWGAETTETYDIVVLNEDDGTGPWDSEDPAWFPNISSSPMGFDTAKEFFDEQIIQGHATAGELFLEEVLRNSVHEDNTTKMFNIRVVDTFEEGEDMVRKEEAVVLVIIPANFTSSIQGIVDKAIVDEIRAHSLPAGDPLPGYANATVNLSGTLGNFDYSFSASLVQAQLMIYTEILEAQTRNMYGEFLLGGAVSLEGAWVGAEFTSIGDTEDFTIFDFMAPGLIIFALMMLTMGVTQTLVTEVKDKTLRRLRLTKMKAIDMMTGTVLRWMAMGILQVLILFVVALAIGTHFAGNYWVTIPVAIGIALVVVLASISMGLIISAFVEDPDQAVNLATLIVVPMSFFTGAFFPLDIEFAQVLPWTQGANAMKQALIFSSLEDAAVHTLYAAIGAFVLFIIGIYVFHKKRLVGT